ncbi:MAG: hypothetical protein VB096_01155 [Pseudoflavonifractor sp.]|nr:hypothetical protein [Pseudoflavonifractor sp.]
MDHLISASYQRPSLPAFGGWGALFENTDLNPAARPLFGCKIAHSYHCFLNSFVYFVKKLFLNGLKSGKSLQNGH